MPFSDEELSSLDQGIQSIGDAGRQARVKALGGVDANPDQAARSLELSSRTGVHPDVIDLDPERFEQGYKEQATAQAVATDPHLERYINSYPLAAKVSNDDWEPLSKLGAAASKLSQDVGSAALQGFKEGFGDQPLLPQVPLSSPEYVSELLAPFGRFVSGLVHGTAKTVGAIGSDLGLGTPEKVEREIGGLLEWSIMRGDINLAHTPNLHPQIKEALDHGLPYLAKGEIPPPGVHEVFDDAHKERAKADGKALKEAEGEANKTATKERAPDALEAFARSPTEGRTIGVSAEAVRELYGDKEPEPQDGVLGWVPGLAEQLRAAEAIGGDIEVPLSGWLAHTSKEAQEALHDHVRVRPDGMSLFETKSPEKRAEGLGVLEDEEAKPVLGKPITENPKQAEKTPPVEEGFVRFYHGADEGAEPGEGGGRWVTPDATYARDFRSGGISKNVHYVDIPIGDPTEVAARAWDEFDEGTSIVGHYRSIEVPEELAKQMKPFPMEGAPFEEAEHPILSVEDLARKEAGLAPLVESGQTYRLKKVGEEAAPQIKGEKTKDEPFRQYEIHGDRGVVGKLDTQLTNKKMIFVSNIEATEGAGAFGTKAMLRLARELQKEYPEATSIGGYRVSGARGEEAEFIQIPLKRLAESEKAREEFTEAIQKPPKEGAKEGLFENAKAIGMSKERFGRYQKLMDKDNEEREARELARATDRAEKEQRAEYRQAKREITEQVTQDIDDRPDIAADEALRNGIFGEGKTKLDIDSLSEEQKVDLPKDSYGKGGVSPSSIASLFGYDSGEALVAGLGRLNAIREGLGLEPKEYKEGLVKEEVERQLAARFANADENILDRAREEIRTPSQMERLHEDLFNIGVKAGIKPPFTKQSIEAGVGENFKNVPISQARDPMHFIRASGRAGRATEEALERGDFQEAFKQKQRQLIAEVMVREAQKVQKEVKKTEAFLKRFAQRKVSSVSQEYTDQIHGIMAKLDQHPSGRSVQDLATELAKRGSLQDFVSAKEADLREVPVADFLFDPSFKKALNRMSVEEYRAVDSSLKALAHNGRSELQIEKAGEKADLEAVRKAMVDQLETFDAAEPPPLGQGRGKLLGVSRGAPKKALRTFVAAHLQMETLLNRWDRFQPQGVFNQYVMRPLAESANRLSVLERHYSAMVRDLKDKENLKETIENPILIDPLSKTIDSPDGVPYIMSRKNLRAVMANMGNASNLEKLLKGFDVSAEGLHAWVNRVAKKEDWDFVQKQGDIFKEIKAESDRMYERLTGVSPESIEITPIQTPHGEYPGWYHPIIYDRLREGGSKKLMGKNGLEEPEYYRATTPAGYTKKRTGYTAPLSLELDEVQTRMKQMLHDIAMREAVINAGKIFYDKDVRSAIAKHSFLGPEVKDMLVPYLKDVANHSNIDSAAAHVGAQWSEFFRQNIISTLIGLNPGTVLKHGPTAAIQSLQEVGVGNFAREVKDLLKPLGGANWKFAMETSEELQRRHRNYQETLGGGYKEAFQEQNLRTIVQHIGSYPVAISDLMSAVPTWLAKYREMMEDGSTKGDAIFEADRAVRRAHGSTAMTNRPVVMRGGATAQWFSSVFGFFSHIMNRQVELVWKAGDTLGKVKNGELSEALKDTPQLASGLFAYVLWPALVEEMVTPLSNDQHESWGTWAAKALVKDLSASWIGIRDVTQAVLTGHDPAMGLIGSAIKPASDIGRDVVAMATKGKDRAGKLIEHGATALGAATGLVNAQMGRTAEFAYNVASGKDKPRGMGEWLHGLRFGASKTKKR